MKSDDSGFYADDAVRGGEGIATTWKQFSDFEAEPLDPEGLRELLD